jgi:hypothetical protein
VQGVTGDTMSDTEHGAGRGHCTATTKSDSASANTNTGVLDPKHWARS